MTPVLHVVRSTIGSAIAAGELWRIDPGAGEPMLLGIVRGVHDQRPLRGDRIVEEAMDLFLQSTAPASRRYAVRRKVAR